MKKLIHGKRCTKFSVPELTLSIYDCTSDKLKSEKKSETSQTDSKAKPQTESLFRIETEPKIQDILDVPMYGKVCSY